MTAQTDEERYSFVYTPPLTRIYVQVTGLPKPILVGECDGFDYSYEGSVTDDGIESEWTLTIRDPNRELLSALGFRFPGDHPPEPQQAIPTAEIPAATPDATPTAGPTTPAGSTRMTAATTTTEEISAP
jgi:hypothetical protein